MVYDWRLGMRYEVRSYTAAQVLDILAEELQDVFVPMEDKYVDVAHLLDMGVKSGLITSRERSDIRFAIADSI